MSTNAVLVTMVGLTLATSIFVAVAVGTGDTARISDLEEQLAESNRQNKEFESLKSEVARLSSRIDRRIGAFEQRPRARAADTDAAAAVAGTAAIDASAAAKLEEALAERLEKTLDKKMDQFAARSQNRGADGKWKPQMDALSTELELDVGQSAEATRIFDAAKDEVYVLLKTVRLDGGSLLDDFAEDLRDGDPGEATKTFFSRIFTEKLPGTDRTYLTEVMEITEEVNGALGEHLTEAQMGKLQRLNVDVLDVKTGYDPIGDYIRAKFQ